MRKNKIPITKVQDAFNAAIRRRDGRCMIKDYEPCEGQLECSHFITVGCCNALRFYPMNAWAQCSKHHWRHHHSKEHFYYRWLIDNHEKEFDEMLSLAHHYIKYTDWLKAEIIRLCNADKLDELKELIEKELGK